MFRATYDGECAFCGEPIDEGDLMGLASGDNADGFSIDGAPACPDCAEDLGDESA